MPKYKGESKLDVERSSQLFNDMLESHFAFFGETRFRTLDDLPRKHFYDSPGRIRISFTQGVNGHMNKKFEDNDLRLKPNIVTLEIGDGFVDVIGVSSH